jgi:hypothetical protein
MRNRVMSLNAPERGCRWVLRYAMGLLAAASVLGVQAAPALAVDRRLAATATAAGKAADKAGEAGKAAERVARTAAETAAQRAAREVNANTTANTNAHATAKVKAETKAAVQAKAKAIKRMSGATKRASGATTNVPAPPPGDVQARSAPSAVDATVDGQAATVTIAWTLPDENTAAVGFRLNGPTTIECPGTATAGGSCELTEVPPGTYAVQYDEDGGGWVDGGASAEVPVAPPADVTATPTVHGLNLAWEPSPSPGVTGYVATVTPVDVGDGDQPAHCESMTGCAITDLTYRAHTVSVVAKVDQAQSQAATVEAIPLPETPAAPTGVTATLSGPNAITISWNAVTSNYGVAIKYMGGIGAENWGQGCWDEPMNALTCTVDGLPAGTAYTITAFAVGDVTSEPGRAAAKVTIPLPASVPARAPTMRSNLKGADPVVGGKITISGRGYRPFSTVVLAIYSTPVVLGSATARADGTFAATVTLPKGQVGSHTLLASGVDAGGNPRYMKLAVNVAEAGGGAGGLPLTGSPVALLLLIGAGLVMGGGGTLVVSRPRRATTTA